MRQLRTYLFTTFLFIISFLLFFASPSLADDPVRKQQSPLGINLAGVRDYSTEMPFVDVFMHAREWLSQEKGKSWGKGPKLELTKEGWVKSLKPGQYASALICWSKGNPEGRYICLYKGTGKIEFDLGPKVVKRSEGRIEIDVAKDGKIMLNIVETDPSDPIRDIHVIMPGFEKTWKTDTFYPHFIERCKSFSVMRFMDWMDTNNSEIKEWSERPKPSDISQIGKGVALEYMIDLCNKTHTDPWFCMPHLASDDYIRQFAKMTKKRLNPNLKIYIEHSNEVWNSQFKQSHYASRRGIELGLSTNKFQAQLNYHSKRSVEIFKIWEEVFGGHKRFVRVLGSQSSNPWVSEQMMIYEDAWKHADVVAIAPYFGGHLGTPKHVKRAVNMSLDELFKECRAGIARNREKIKEVVANAKKRNLDVISYEGGQHLVGVYAAQNDKKLMNLFHRANRDPRMKQLYLEDYASWKESGGKLFTVFSSVGKYSKHGSWGILEAENQKTSPKYEATLEFIQKNPVWWKE